MLTNIIVLFYVNTSKVINSKVQVSQMWENTTETHLGSEL